MKKSILKNPLNKMIDYKNGLKIFSTSKSNHLILLLKKIN